MLGHGFPATVFSPPGQICGSRHRLAAGCEFTKSHRRVARSTTGYRPTRGNSGRSLRMAVLDIYPRWQPDRLSGAGIAG
jgi:hypothetical protein